MGNYEWLYHRRVQHPIGQGFFHSGCIRAASDSRHLPYRLVSPVQDYLTAISPMRSGDLFYVYDCGAMPPYSGRLDKAINRLCRCARGKVLDFLFLSHLHADHVNGVPDLLSPRGGLQVDTIVMPLTDDVERLIAFAGSLDNGATSAGDEFYEAFVVDPIAALGRFSPRQIILATRARPGGDDGAPDGGVAVEPEGRGPIGPDAEDQPRDGRADRADGEMLRWKLVGHGRVERWPGDDTGTTLTQPAPALYRVDDTIAIRVADNGPAWLLSPYVDPGIRQRGVFLRTLAVELDMSPHAVRMLVSNTEGRRALITKFAVQLRRAYSSIAKDLNLTSMCLLSGAAPAGARELMRSHSQWGPWTIRPQGMDQGRIAWLATGDAALGKIKRCRAFLWHYRRHLPYIMTLTMPHHGSDASFNASLLRRTNPQVCIAAAGTYRNWRHPGTNVVQAVASIGLPLRIVNDSEKSEFAEFVMLCQTK